MSTGWRGGSTRAWRRTRALVLQRDKQLALREGGVWCRVRVPGVCVGDGVPMHVHHLDGVGAGHRIDRLVAACAPCNLHIGDPTKRGDDPVCIAITQW